MRLKRGTTGTSATSDLDFRTCNLDPNGFSLPKAQHNPSPMHTQTTTIYIGSVALCGLFSEGLLVVACLCERGHYQAPTFIAVVALVVSEMPVDT